MTLREHIPAYIDRGWTPREAEGETIEKILETDWVQRWPRTYPRFHRFSIGHRGEQQLLMAEMHDGKLWQVVGYLTGYAGELPAWHKPGVL